MEDEKPEEKNKMLHKLGNARSQAVQEEGISGRY